MLKFIGVVAACVMLAACQTSGQRPRALAPGEFESPIQPGQTRLRLVNPDREKWVARGSDTTFAAQTHYFCRPSVCSTPTSVGYSRSTRPPGEVDREVLLQVGRSLEDRARLRGLTVTSPVRTGTHRGYPSLHFATRREIDGRIEHHHNSVVFLRNMSFLMISRASDSEVARRNLDQFLNAVIIKDGGPRHASR